MTLIKSDIKTRRTMTDIKRSGGDLSANPVGRPTKLTPKVIKRLSEAIAGGHHYRFACAAAGVHQVTFEKWIKTGREDLDRLEDLSGTNVHARSKDITPHVQLYLEIQKALYKAQDEPLRCIRLAAKNGDWRAAAHFLERRFPEHWGKNTDESNTQPAPTIQTVIMVPKRAESIAEWDESVMVRRSDHQKQLEV